MMKPPADFTLLRQAKYGHTARTVIYGLGSGEKSGFAFRRFGVVSRQGGLSPKIPAELYCFRRIPRLA